MVNLIIIFCVNSFTVSKLITLFNFPPLGQDEYKWRKKAREQYELPIFSLSSVLDWQAWEWRTNSHCNKSTQLPKNDAILVVMEESITHTDIHTFQWDYYALGSTNLWEQFCVACRIQSTWTDSNMGDIQPEKTIRFYCCCCRRKRSHKPGWQRAPHWSRATSE